MTKAADPLTELRNICLALPDTKETITWGKPHFRVKEKIFAGYGDERGKTVIGFKLEMDHAAAIIQVPGFTRAMYVGHKGWVSLDVSTVSDWEMVRELILKSYQLIAPKRCLAKLELITMDPPVGHVTNHVPKKKAPSRVQKKTTTTKRTRKKNK